LDPIGNSITSFTKNISVFIPLGRKEEKYFTNSLMFFDPMQEYKEKRLKPFLLGVFKINFFAKFTDFGASRK